MKAALPAIALSAIAASVSAQVPAGGEFRVNTYTTDAQWAATPAMEPDGDFVIVWQSAGQLPGGTAILGQRFSSSGVPRGGEFTLTPTGGAQIGAHVDVGARGDFVAVWTGAGDGSDSSIQGRRFDALGTPVGSEFVVNAYTTGSQRLAKVALAADGSFDVTWLRERTPLSGTGEIPVRRFGPLGQPIGSEFVVNAATTDNQGLPDIAVAPDGSFIVAWYQVDNSVPFGDSTVLARRFTSTGGPAAPVFTVPTDSNGRQIIPSVAVAPSGDFVIAFASQAVDGSSYGAAARRFSWTGNPIGSEFRVNTYTTGLQVGGRNQVATDSFGNFVITWAGVGPGDADGVFAQRFSSSGARRGAEFRVNDWTTGEQRDSAIASDAAGNFVITWYDPVSAGSTEDIFARRFGGLAPAGLAVDSTGNGVIEAGETVDIRPRWRNFNGAAQTFAGTLAGITGPAGATYAITDPAADYGTVADGAIAPCGDCYAVAVSNPTVRPAVHWDASAIESILPDAQGQQKQWLLHVGRSFTDVPPTSGFYRFVETLLHHGVTGGCTAATYCPGFSATREQMAVFVLVAKEGSAYVPPACIAPMFSDVSASSPFCRWIEELARRGVVSGCGSGSYCPSVAVTREQMAVFVLRTLDPALTPPACTTPMYSDVPATSGFCRWIEELTRRSIVTGCGGGNYCPAAPVTREQMGVFISVTFGLTLYGP